MMRRGVPIVTLFGIPIKIHSSWLVIALLLTLGWSAELTSNFPSLSRLGGIALGFSGALLLFGSVLAHELSHALVALRNRIRIRGITLFIFGGAAEMEEEPPTPGIELKVAIAGPSMSLALALGFLLLARIPSGWVSEPLLAIAGRLALTNAVLVAFNVVPGFPLDGGRVLRAMLWHVWGELAPATKVAANLGVYFGWLLVFFGFVMVWSFGLYGAIWFILIGVFLAVSARGSYQQTRLREALAGVTARELMNVDAALLTVTPETSLAWIVDEIVLPRGMTALPVVEAGRLVGLLRVEDIRSREPAEWPQLTAADLLRPRDRLAVVSPETDAIEVLKRINEARDVAVVPVAEEGDHLVGLVTRDELFRRIQLHLQLRA